MDEFWVGLLQESDATVVGQDRVLAEWNQKLRPKVAMPRDSNKAIWLVLD